MQRLIFVFALLPVLAQAHEGHGMEGVSHYHATDVWGFVSVAVAAAAAWWFSGRDK